MQLLWTVACVVLASLSGAESGAELEAEAVAELQSDQWCDNEASRRALHFSSAAYCSRFKYHLLPWQGYADGFVFHSLFHDDEMNIPGFVGFLPSTGEVIVTFKGSRKDSAKNWIGTNLKFSQVAYPFCDGCKVHKGFYWAKQHVIDSIAGSVGALSKSYQTAKVVVTGHSLGGALATLVALEVKTVGYDVKLYTFGSPRVGNDEFAAYTNQRLSDIRRFVYNKDPVPHLPPRLIKYRHVAFECFEQGGTVSRCDGSGEDPSCSGQFSFHLDYLGNHYHYLGTQVDCPYPGMSLKTEEQTPDETHNHTQIWIVAALVVFSVVAALAVLFVRSKFLDRPQPAKYGTIEETLLPPTHELEEEESFL